MKLLNTQTNHKYQGALTTEHAASSYGQPVLVDQSTGDAVDQFSVALTVVLEATDDELRELAAAGYTWLSTVRDGALLNGWSIDAGQLVGPDGRVYGEDDPVYADDVAAAIGVPAEVTRWTNGADTIPARYIVKEAEYYVARARAETAKTDSK